MSTYCVYEYVLHINEQLLDIDQGGFDIHGKLVLSPSASPYHTQSHLTPPPTLSHQYHTSSPPPYHTPITPHPPHPITPNFHT